MRLSYVLLVATATTLLASGTMATVTGRKEISTPELPDAVTSIGTDAGGEKRFLRSHGNENRGDEDEDDEDMDDDDDEEEERAGGLNLFASWKLDEMVEGTKRLSRFQRWKDNGYNPVKLSKLGKLDDYDSLLKKYRTWYYHRSG